MVKFVDGNALCRGYLSKYISRAQVMLHDIWCNNHALSSNNHQWLHHIFRENNGIADGIADIAARNKSIYWLVCINGLIETTAVRTLFDGSAGKSGLGSIPAAGVVIQISNTPVNTWSQASQLGVPLPPNSTSMFAETAACILAIELTRHVLINHSLPTLCQIQQIVEYNIPCINN